MQRWHCQSHGSGVAGWVGGGIDLIIGVGDSVGGDLGDAFGLDDAGDGEKSASKTASPEFRRVLVIVDSGGRRFDSRDRRRVERAVEQESVLGLEFGGDV